MLNPNMKFIFVKNVYFSSVAKFISKCKNGAVGNTESFKNKTFYKVLLTKISLSTTFRSPNPNAALVSTICTELPYSGLPDTKMAILYRYLRTNDRFGFTDRKYLKLVDEPFLIIKTT